MIERKGAVRTSGGPHALFLVAAVVVALVGTAAGASAATITQPAARPIVAATDASGDLVALTIEANGFPPDSPVFVEQCDGTNPTTPQWSPTEHCDLGSSPAPATSDAHGFVRFAASDSSHAFAPFVGESPQSIFNCVARSATPPGNGLPSFTTCKVRVSTNNAAPTSDQVFASLVLPPNAKNPPHAPSSVTTAHGARGAPAPTAAKNTRTSASAAVTASAAKVSAVGVARVRPADTTRVARSHSSDPGWLDVTDPGVAIGYGALIAGLTVAALATLRKRRARVARRS